MYDDLKENIILVMQHPIVHIFVMFVASFPCGARFKKESVGNYQLYANHRLGKDPPRHK